MAKEALNKVLSDIHMSSYESEFYEKYLTSVQRQILQLRVTLDGLESKKKERCELHFVIGLLLFSFVFIS
jgi:hypothetical protein